MPDKKRRGALDLRVHTGVLLKMDRQRWHPGRGRLPLCLDKRAHGPDLSLLVRRRAMAINDGQGLGEGP